jgi:hypothetical protein
MMVDPHFISSDSVAKKGVTFLMVFAPKVVTDVQMVTPLLFLSCFRTHLAQLYGSEQ